MNGDKKKEQFCKFIADYAPMLTKRLVDWEVLDSSSTRTPLNVLENQLVREHAKLQRFQSDKAKTLVKAMAPSLAVSLMVSRNRVLYDVDSNFLTTLAESTPEIAHPNMLDMMPVSTFALYIKGGLPFDDTNVIGALVRVEKCRGRHLKQCRLNKEEYPETCRIITIFLVRDGYGAPKGGDVRHCFVAPDSRIGALGKESISENIEVERVSPTSWASMRHLWTINAIISLCYYMAMDNAEFCSQKGVKVETQRAGRKPGRKVVFRNYSVGPESSEIADSGSGSWAYSEEADGLHGEWIAPTAP